MKMPRAISAIIRLIAGNPEPAHIPLRSAGVAEESVDLSDYEYLGDFTPHATEKLVQRFKKEAIQFTFVCDTSPPDEVGPDSGGCYAERRTVAVYVHRDDFVRSKRLLEMLTCSF